ncbi:MAG: lipopolysaccharide heptosyltransferase II [Elusimicrobia bacterium HGW-Elusimicrobia-1]|jgi:lipopolysaccharide heptosyltransferase II|nr:MAG: lipopolysaccharide heptosyltransferase II [Elusimicrobia bacterium HGW-Elusimicrobia-1]
MMKLSIIIVNYNTRELLAECLASIRKYPPSHKYETIVVDNASSDDSRDMVSRDFSEVKLLANDSNLGFACANNRGIKASDGEYILLLNSDAGLKPGTADTMLDYMDKNPSVGVLGPKLVGPDGDIIQMSWGWCPTIFKELVQKTLDPHNIARYKLVKNIVRRLGARNREVELVYGTSMLIRRKILEKTGLLNENLFLYFEEPDFCPRVKSAGYKVVYLAGAEVTHKHGCTMKVAGKYTTLVYRESQLYFYKKHRSAFQQKILKLYLLFKFYILKFISPAGSNFYDELINLVKETGIERILIIKLSAIGDVLMATPAFETIRNKYPKAKISLLIGNWAKDIVKSNPNIDEIISIDENIFWKKRIIPLLNLFFLLRRKKFNAVYIMHWSNLFNFFTFLLGIKKRIGFDRFGKGMFLTKKVPFSEGEMPHTIYKYGNLVSANLENCKINIYLTDDETNIAEKELANYGLNPIDKIIGIAPGGGENPKTKMLTKRWPVEYFIELIKKITFELNIPVILFGSKTESALGTAIEEAIKKDKLLVNFIGKMDLRQTAAIMKICQIVVTNDSASLHLAGAVGTNTISIFGPTPPWDKIPLGNNHKYFYKKLPCSPCYKYGKFPKCRGISCLRSIKPDEVFQKVKELIL